MTEKIRLPGLSTEKDFEGTSFAAIYSTTVTVTGGTAGHGRASGRARSDDGALDLELRMPAELGGDGDGTNPEQLFAAGFAACFHGALSLVARQAALSAARRVPWSCGCGRWKARPHHGFRGAAKTRSARTSCSD
jgi:Ohr subfamily peroxiredoxin